jgi:hypothetical protein
VIWPAVSNFDVFSIEELLDNVADEFATVVRERNLRNAEFGEHLLQNSFNSGGGFVRDGPSPRKLREVVHSQEQVQIVCPGILDPFC